MSGKYSREKPPPAGSRLAAWNDTFKRVGTERAWTLLDTVANVAKRHGTSSAAVSIAWLVNKPECSSIILGARDTAQLDHNLKALDVKLTDADMKELDDASKPDWGYPYGFLGQRGAW